MAVKREIRKIALKKVRHSPSKCDGTHGLTMRHCSCDWSPGLWNFFTQVEATPSPFEPKSFSLITKQAAEQLDTRGKVLARRDGLSARRSGADGLRARV